MRLDRDEAGRFVLAAGETLLFSGLDAGCETETGRLSLAELLLTSGDLRLPVSIEPRKESVLTAKTTDGLELSWSLCVTSIRGEHDGGDQWTVEARLNARNAGAMPVQLLRVRPLCASVALDDANAELRSLDTGAGSWGSKSMSPLEKSAEAALISAVADAEQRGVVCGFTSVHRHRGFITWTRDGDALSVSARHETAGAYSACSALGKNNARAAQPGFRSGSTALIGESNPYPGLLQPGEVFESESVYLSSGDALLALERWADLTGETHNAVTMSPAASGFYTWYYYREQVDEQIVLSNARYLAEHRDRLPVNYIHLDWGWQANYSCGDRDLSPGFPNGLRWLADQITTLGFLPGIWLTAFMHDHPSSDLVEDQPELFQAGPSGKPESFGNPIRNFMAEAIPGMNTFIEGEQHRIDPTAEAVHDYLRDRYGWAVAQGFKEVMLDFTLHGVPGPEIVQANPQETWVEAMRSCMRTLRETIGDDSMVMGCGTPYEPMIGYGNFVRVAVDVPANWRSVVRGSMPLLWQYFMHGRLWTNYADAVSVRETPSPYWPLDDDQSPLCLSLDEARFYVTVTGLSAAAVMIAEDLTILPPERERLLSLILPICDDGRFTPVDLFANQAPRLLRREFCRPSDWWAVVAVLNWGDDPDESGATPADLFRGSGMLTAGAGAWHAYDPLDDRYLGVFLADDALAPVAPHGVLCARLTPVTPEPQLVGTSMHISQGAVETAESRWDEAANALIVRTADLYGRTGDLFVSVPDGYAFVSAEVDGKKVAVTEDTKPAAAVIRVGVRLDQERTVTLFYRRT